MCLARNTLLLQAACPQSCWSAQFSPHRAGQRIRLVPAQAAGALGLLRRNTSCSKHCCQHRTSTCWPAHAQHGSCLHSNQAPAGRLCEPCLVCVGTHRLATLHVACVQQRNNSRAEGMPFWWACSGRYCRRSRPETWGLSGHSSSPQWPLCSSRAGAWGRCGAALRQQGARLHTAAQETRMPVFTLEQQQSTHAKGCCHSLGELQLAALLRSPCRSRSKASPALLCRMAASSGPRCWVVH